MLEAQYQGERSAPETVLAPPRPADLVFHPSATRDVAWERDAADRFTRRMLDRERPFPCIFGTDALRRGSLRFAFVPDGVDPDGHLADVLRDFVAMAPALGRRTSLVAFFEPSPGVETLEDHRDWFWSLMQSLHVQDTEPWPADIPVDAEHSMWEFCFAGMPMFVVANTPAHQHRASRYFEYFCITFQPRFVFEDIGEDSAQGQSARKIIRSRLRAYDTLAPNPMLGSFGAPGNREWTQYFLEDDNEVMPETARCPMHMGGSGEVSIISTEES
jgi:FPC/CPF motif-containing protein YcgG